jgi:predicted dehydrogenase
VNIKIKTVLIIGLGSIGKRHAKIIKDLFPGIKIIALRHSEFNKDDLIKYGLSNCVSSIKDALAHNPDAAIISNPASKHLKFAKILAKNGISLLIEKPISNSVDGVDDLIKLCERNNCILMIAYNLKFLPSLVEFKNQIDINRVGKILSVQSEVGQYLPSWRPEIDYRNSVSAKKDLGGGVLLELSHDIDYLCWIFGTIKWVSANVSKQSSLDIDVEDNANIHFGFNNNLCASLNMDFFRHDASRKCFAIGEKGTLLWDGIANEVKYFEKGAKDWEIIFMSNSDQNFTYSEQLKTFFDEIGTQNVSNVSGQSAKQVISLVEAIKKSNNINSKIYL